MNLIVIIIIVVLLFGGGGGYYAHSYYGGAGLRGVLGIVLDRCRRAVVAGPLARRARILRLSRKPKELFLAPGSPIEETPKKEREERHGIAHPRKRVGFLRNA